MADRPARNNTMLNPRSCQIPITARVGRTRLGSLRKAISFNPKKRRTALMGPSRGWRMACQTVAIAIRVEVTGRK
jgi:hypothetical protein